MISVRHLAIGMGAAALAACGTIEHEHVALGPPRALPTRVEPQAPPPPKSAWGVEDPAIVMLASAVVDEAPAEGPTVNLACFVQGPAELEEGAWFPGDYPDVAGSFISSATREVVAVADDTYKAHLVVRDLPLTEGETLSVWITDVDELSHDDMLFAWKGPASRAHPFELAPKNPDWPQWQMTCRFLPSAAIEAALSDLDQRLAALLDGELARLGRREGSVGINRRVGGLVVLRAAIDGRESVLPADLQRRRDQCEALVEAWRKGR